MLRLKVHPFLWSVYFVNSPVFLVTWDVIFHIFMYLGNFLVGQVNKLYDKYHIISNNSYKINYSYTNLIGVCN